MLSEFGLIPDIFDSASYSSAVACDIHLSRLKDVLISRGMVRDFRDGEWRNYVLAHQDRWDRRAKELIKKLANQNRLALAPAAGTVAPANEADWCQEALLSHQALPLTSIITSARQAAACGREEVVTAIEEADSMDWWEDKMQSVRLRPTTNEYLKLLGPILKRANLLMFLDPYLDPSAVDYGEFVSILLAACRPTGAPLPLIQLHRVVHHGHNRAIGSLEYWQKRFACLCAPLRKAGLKAEVLIWDEFHDRHLVSDLIGILMGNGFETSNNPTKIINWARITRQHREQLQKEFDYPNNVFHELRCRFTVGT